MRFMQKREPAGTELRLEQQEIQVEDERKPGAVHGGRETTLSPHVIFIVVVSVSMPTPRMGHRIVFRL